MIYDDKILSLIISTLGFSILLVGYYVENIFYIRLFLFLGSFILMLWGLICFDLISGLSIYLFNFIYSCINLYRLMQINNKQQYTQIE
jgi:hypothetical protein